APCSARTLRTARRGWTTPPFAEGRWASKRGGTGNESRAGGVRSCEAPGPGAARVTRKRPIEILGGWSLGWHGRHGAYKTGCESPRQKRLQRAFPFAEPARQ